MELPHVLCLAPLALAQDPEAEIPRDHFIISFLMSALRSHPDSERLISMIYNLLTIISSQGECAGLFLSFLSTLKIQDRTEALGDKQERSPFSRWIAILFSALNGSHGYYLEAEDSGQESDG